MALIGKISRGSRMDQVYLPKDRTPGYETGTAVLISPVQEKHAQKLYYYNVKYLEPVKVSIIHEIFNYLEAFENVMVAGSFLEKGFNFEDIDIIVITDKKVDRRSIEGHFRNALGVRTHIIALNFKTLLKGIRADPLFGMLVSRFVSKNRVVFNTKREFNYKLLDLDLLKSKALLDNIGELTGNEMYKLTRNMIAIVLFINNRKLSAESVNREIESYFGEGSVNRIKNNMVGRDFFVKYRNFYNKIFDRIMAGVRNGSKQE